MLKAMTPITAAAIAAAMTVGAPAAKADEIADFYKGKTVTVMVPSGLGATLGLYGRLLTEHFHRHIPGNPTVILTSRPGGGGTKGAAFAYNAAPKDGTFIAEILSASVLAGKLRKAKFDVSKFVWLGSIAQRPIVVSVWRDSTPAKTIEEARQKEVIMGSSGLGSETYMAPQLMNVLLGTKFKIVKGYKGGAAINKAIEQVEVQGRMQYWSGWTAGKPQWLADGKLIHLVQYGPTIKELPNVPAFKDLVKDPRKKQMLTFMEASPKVGMGFWVAPEVPKARVAALRKAFMDTMKDPNFLADAKKRKAPVEPIAGEKLDKVIAEAYATPDDVIKELSQLLGFSK
jgi:tripartite-type tricarboxylate transporter receptor subunit TctC